MANKISNFSDLIQRVTISCLLNPLVQAQEPPDDTDHSLKPQFQFPSSQESEDYYDETQESGQSGETPSSEKLQNKKTELNSERMMESEALITEMFDAVSDLKKAYVTLQQAHSPWDPVKMSIADAAMVKQFKRMGRLKERYKRISRSGEGVKKLGISTSLREAVAPYEETVKELKREVKEKEAEVENLKEKLSSVSVSGKKAKFHQSKKKLGFNQAHVAVAPVPQLFEATMRQVKETSKSFTLLLLSLMRSAHWDLAAAVRSIESATNTTDDHDNNTLTMGSHHAKYALESYICSKIFHGFDHETFYIDGSLSSLLNPEQYRKDCFSQFRDMNSMDPTELLGILPTCQFGQFCSKKYLSIIHPKMEESLFGDLEQNKLVSAGNHPRSKFYGQFLKVAKAVWLLHLLAFSLDPSPCLFLATKGAEFQPEYMESVVRYSGRGMHVSQQIVGVPVSPGFKLGNGCIIKARVYLVPRK